MYFKIINIGEDKYTAMGMINIDAQLFLEPGDDGYEKYIAEHYVTVPVIPEGGYPRQIDLDSATKKWEDKLQSLYGENPDGVYVAEDYDEYNDFKNQSKSYTEWLKSLPTIKQLNPFCTHSIQFEHDVTEEEILWCFEFALGITHRNYLKDDLHCKKGGQVVNQPFHYSARRAFYQGVGVIPEKIRSDYMKKEMAKADKAANALAKLKDVEFSSIQTIAKYSVRK